MTMYDNKTKPYMIKSIQLAIMQAFTAIWKIKFEQIVIILNFPQNFIFQRGVKA